MPQKFTYRVERVTRVQAEVTIEVSEQELDTLNHQQLEQKAINSVRGIDFSPESFKVTMPLNTTYMAALLHREEA